MIKLLMADDNAILREGLKQLFIWAGDIIVSGVAENGKQVLEQLKLGVFDILLLDLTMPEPSGLDLIEKIRSAGINLPILVFTMHNDPQIVKLTLRAGASGYLTKDADPENLLKVIREIASGRHYNPVSLDNQEAYFAH